MHVTPTLVVIAAAAPVDVYIAPAPSVIDRHRASASRDLSASTSGAMIMAPPLSENIVPAM